MKQFALLLVAMVAGSMLFGCKSTQPEPKKQLGQFTISEEAKAKKIAFAYAEDIMKGLTEDNYKLFAKNLTPQMQKKITANKFKVMRKKLFEGLGEYKSRTYLTSLNNVVFKEFVWKAVFEKEVADKNKKPRKFQKQLLFRMVLGKIDNKYVVLGFGFQ
jgi:hypothetical protein